MPKNILKLIKKRASTRRYLNKDIPQNYIDKIIEAGIWGPAIHHIQPWEFVVVKDRHTIRRISDMIIKEIREKNPPGFILYPSIPPLSTAELLIFAYNTGEFTNTIKKFRKKLFRRVKITEISAISAAIQNMLLVAESLGIGSCWLNSPLFCKEEVNKLLHIDHDLVAVLTFGFYKECGKRAIRKPLSKSVKYI